MPLELTYMLAESAHGNSAFALDLLAILAASGVVTLLLRRYPQAMIPCYLIAGAIIGPYALGLAGHAGGAQGETQSVGSLATIMLLFTIGLHLDVRSLRGGIAPTALVTVVAATATVAVLWPLIYVLGLPAPASLAVAMALSISSTTVVLRILELRRELHRLHGRLTFGILLTQDMVALGIMASIPFLATWAQAGVPDQVAKPRETGLTGLSGPLGLLADAGVAIAGIVALIYVGRRVLPRLLRSAAAGGDTLLIVASAIALGAAVAAAGLGFSPELGAFLAGFLLASTPFRYQISGQLVPLRELFLAVFFTALGLELPLEPLLGGWWIILIVVAATVVVKSIVIASSSWAAGASAGVAVYAGLAMAQGSEFSLVILTQARDNGVIGEEPFAYMIAVVVLTLVMTPPMMELARWGAVRTARVRPAPWVRASALRETAADHADESDEFEPEEPVEERPAEPRPPRKRKERPATAIVAGFGPVGRAVADELEKQHVRITVIDLNPRTVERQHGLGRSVVYGDASNPEVLDRAGIRKVGALILTMPDEEAVLRACRLARTVRPDIFVAARLNSLSKAIQAMQFGADHTVVEEMATAEAMASQVLLKLRQRKDGEDTGPRLYR